GGEHRLVTRVDEALQQIAVARLDSRRSDRAAQATQEVGGRRRHGITSTAGGTMHDGRRRSGKWSPFSSAGERDARAGRARSTLYRAAGRASPVRPTQEPGNGPFFQPGPRRLRSAGGNNPATPDRQPGAVDVLPAAL